MNSYVKKYDHRKLGEELELFEFHEEAPGFPFYYQKGIFLRNFLIELWRARHREHNYVEISSPQLMSSQLWEVSGHKELYSEMMFYSNDGHSDYALKPMSCPGAMLYFKRRLRSFRELPFRVCELGHVHRNEPSGSRNGLLRARSFVQDDGHIFCEKDQVKEEVIQILDFAKDLLSIFGFRDYHFELSLRDFSNPDKYLGEDEDWIFLEKILVQIMQEKGLLFKKKIGDAKFYGPSLDLHLKDSNGKNWQCSSIQLDFNLPHRFDCSFVNSSGDKERPFLIHRALFGSLERFLGILLEHYQGHFPLWLAPVQVRIVSFGDKHEKYLKEVMWKLRSEGIRVEGEANNAPLGKKIREFYKSKIPYLVILGDKEESRELISYRSSSGEEEKEILLADFIKGDDHNMCQRPWSLYEF